VVGDADAIEPARPVEVDDLGHGQAAVGVVGVDVKIAEQRAAGAFGQAGEARAEPAPLTGRRAGRTSGGVQRSATSHSSRTNRAICSELSGRLTSSSRCRHWPQSSPSSASARRTQRATSRPFSATTPTPSDWTRRALPLPAPE